MLSPYWQVNIISGTRMEKTREGNRFMHIYDLTGGKYGLIAETISYSAESKILDQMERTSFPNKNFLFNRFHTDWWKENTKKILNETPVFLVESSMCQKVVSIPGSSLYTTIPNDTCIEYDEDNKIDWEKLFSGAEINSERGLEKESLSSNILDLFGVYINNPYEGIVPSKIFVWIDKIYKWIDNIHKKSQNNGEFEAFVEFIVLHEFGHAIMDVENYDVHHNHIFTYENNIVYRYIEEAYANAFALYVQFESLPDSTRHIIADFVQQQPKRYAIGMNIYWDDNLRMNEWMSIKVLPSIVFFHELKSWWLGTKSFCDLSNIFLKTFPGIVFTNSTNILTMKAPQYKTTANGKTEVHDFTYLPAVTSMLDTLQHHDLTMENIYQISLWKVDRYPQLDYLTLDALNSVKDDTNLDVAKTRDILEKLLNTQGVGLPMASAYLRFINPQVYQIIDHRAYRAAFDYKEPLHANDSVKNLCDTYIKYLEKLQGIADNGYHGIFVDFEDLDRFLYDVDKKAGYTVNMPLKDINRDLWKDVVKNLGGKFQKYLITKDNIGNIVKNHRNQKNNKKL